MRQRLVRSGEVDYQVERSNSAWADHRLRTLVTAATIAWLRPDIILDPACGDGSIVSTALSLHPIRHVYLGDISRPNIEALERAAGLRLALNKAKLACLPVDELLTQVKGTTDVVVLTEILEHLEDPDATLRLAKAKSRYLVASSPEMRPGQVDTNPEHLWMFDRDGYRGMLAGAGWTVQQYTHLNFPTEYDFGIWVCS